MYRWCVWSMERCFSGYILMFVYDQCMSIDSGQFWAFTYYTYWHDMGEWKNPRHQQINPEKHDDVVFLRCAATDCHDARANRKACHQMIGVLWWRNWTRTSWLVRWWEPVMPKMACWSKTYSGWLRNPATVDRWFIPLFIGFQSSKVVQDFFHLQYEVYRLCFSKWNC